MKCASKDIPMQKFIPILFLNKKFTSYSIFFYKKFDFEVGTSPLAHFKMATFSNSRT